jgi:hypothetical protein
MSASQLMPAPASKKHPWAKAVVRSAIAVFQTREEAAAAEAKAIRAERPKYTLFIYPKMTAGISTA